MSKKVGQSVYWVFRVRASRAVYYFFVVILLLTSVVYDGNLKQLADDFSEYIYMRIGKLSSLFAYFLFG